MPTTFKSVEYAGFDGQPELKQVAEFATNLLALEIRSWRDEVQIAWRPAPPDSAAAIELTVSLALPNASASVTRPIRRRDCGPGELGRLRSSVRSVWMDLLDELIDQMSAQREAALAELVEA